MDGLFEALTQIYNDQESSKVLRLTQKVASVFAKGSRFADTVELEELKQLKADAQASRVLVGLLCHKPTRFVVFPNLPLDLSSTFVATSDFVL